MTNTNDDRQGDHTTKDERTNEERRYLLVDRLLIKESLVIRAQEPRLNRTTHSVPLLVFPEGLERHLVSDPNG